MVEHTFSKSSYNEPCFLLFQDHTPNPSESFTAFQRCKTQSTLPVKQAKEMKRLLKMTQLPVLLQRLPSEHYYEFTGITDPFRVIFFDYSWKMRIEALLNPSLPRINMWNKKQKAETRRCFMKGWRAPELRIRCPCHNYHGPFLQTMLQECATVRSEIRENPFDIL